MNRSPTKSPSRKTIQHPSNRAGQSPNQLQHKFYFCHYKNAMYMGGMKSFQRSGQGILLYDNGVSAVCHHDKDFLNGHQIVFGENLIMSLLYQKNRVLQCAFRDSQYILLVRYSKQMLADGKGVLLDFKNKAIFYVLYKKGHVIQKRQEKEFSVKNHVLELENFQSLIGSIHSKAFKYEMEENESIMSQKIENKLNVGFYKRGLLNGLGFSLIFQEPGFNNDLDNEKFSLRHIERGYFHNSQLSGMGEKWFKNGNYYFGDFKDNIFEGRGILKNTSKNNWVYGTFEKGNLAELLQFSHQGQSTKCSKIIQLMHERKSTWIDKQVDSEDPEIFRQQITNILNSNSSIHVKSLHLRKQEVLKKIQDNFICENQDHSFAEQNKNMTSYNEIYENRKNQKAKSPQKKSFDYGIQNSYNSPSTDHRKSPQRFIHSQSATRYQIKIKQAPNTTDSSRRKRISEFSAQKSSKDQYPISKNESSIFNVEQKILQKSRNLKYISDQEEDQSPTFNYKIQY